jgi:hypothetical protein
MRPPKFFTSHYIHYIVVCEGGQKGDRSKDEMSEERGGSKEGGGKISREGVKSGKVEMSKGEMSGNKGGERGVAKRRKGRV